MAFDQSTRNRLNRFVGDARTLLAAEFTRQLQHEYGMAPATGEVTPLEKLTALDDAQRETARILRTTLQHYLVAAPKEDAATRRATLDRIVREQAFTILNRLCALRMAEARGVVIESIGQGYRAQGFLLYQQVAGAALGETGDAYRHYLFSLFDELAVELPALFDRFSPLGRLFPRPAALLALLELINHADLRELWAEDETLGWIYQYFNSQEERRQMRAESQAPRNSRELAVRNQFFTPRYVVEFLTDNTLGRIWYEMTMGQTALVERCRYLVRRPKEIFLGGLGFSHDDDAAWVQAALKGDFAALPEQPPLDEISQLALLIDGYAVAPQFGYGDVLEFGSDHMRRYLEEGATFPGDALELWLILFAYQRGYLRQGWRGSEEDDPILRGIRTVYTRLRAALQNPPTDLTQEELLRQPVFIPRRRPKDPRTILMIDPACGSMHFGLYSFDLYEVIYSEAWDFEERYGPDLLLRTDGLRPLHETYPDKAAFLRDVPRLVIEHNIHGIDIDARAVQIAGLSLWLRAQRSWQEQGVKPAARPTIRKSNVVCAEPMPGDRAQLEAFLKTLHDERLESLIRRVLDVADNQRVRATPAMADALCDLVRVVWEEMKLAGEAGSLLKIEASLATAIQRARDEWEQQPLFRVETFRLTEAGAREAKPKVNLTRAVPGETVDFWTWAETLVLAALAQYAEQADGDSYARRLFAADAARGFAFIDVCRKRYDVALMNPPFGVRIESCNGVFESMYGDGRRDLYHYFYMRATGLTYKSGLIGAITPRTLLYQSSYLSLRESWLSRDVTPVAFAELDLGVLDTATVRPVLVVLFHGTTERPVFYRNLKRSASPAIDLKIAIDAIASGAPARSYTLHNLSTFSNMPSQRFSLWASRQIVNVFETEPTLDPGLGKVTEGLSNEDDMRFLRCWWEPIADELNGRWKPFGKYDSRSTFVPDFSIVIDWSDASYRLLGERGNCRANEGLYFQPGIAFTRSCEVGMAATSLPSGLVFSGVSRYFLPNEPNWLGILAYLNTRLVEGLHLVLTPDRDRITGTLRKIPLVIPQSALIPLDRLAHDLWRLKAIWLRDRDETYRGFGFHRPATPEQIISEFAELKEEIEYLEDSIESNVRRDCVLDAVDLELLDNETNARAGVRDLVITSTHLTTLVGASSNLLSTAIGSIWGRWDIRDALGQKAELPLPDPFAPLPACPPGMLQSAAGLPATPADVPAAYPLRISWPGILVDDPGHAEDVVGRVREALAVIWPETHDAIEQEACQILGVASLRAYFGNPTRFFDDHLKRYSKSRRQAPIYWPLSTPSGAYTLWIYYHRLTDQMLYTCVVDFVDPKLKEVGEDGARLRQSTSRSRDDERELARLSDLERELKEFRAELLRLAPIWKPNLNDGVQITAAPLWKLFQHRAWQRTLRETWETLERGDYDWAQLAMAFWPARVVPKCTTDRSLAIAHDVEDRFWVEDNGKWRGLASPAQEIAGQRARQAQRLSERQRSRLLAALRQLATGAARGVAAAQVAQHLAEGEWDDTELALLCWPMRVAEKCLDDAELANTLRLNVPAKRTKGAVNRWINDLAEAGCPDLADALLATLDADEAFDPLLAALEAGRRDHAPLALALWPERVIDRGLENPELAAAHDLRKFFWVEDGGGWRRRREMGVEVAMEIEQRK